MAGFEHSPYNAHKMALRVCCCRPRCGQRPLVGSRGIAAQVSCLLLVNRIMRRSGWTLMDQLITTFFRGPDVPTILRGDQTEVKDMETSDIMFPWTRRAASGFSCHMFLNVTEQGF